MIDDLVDDVNKKRNDERNAKTDLEMVESENNHAWFNWIPGFGNHLFVITYKTNLIRK